MPPPVRLGWAAFCYWGTARFMTLGGRRFLLSLALVGASVCLALGDQPADHQAHQVRILHLRALAHIHGQRTDPLRAVFPRHYGADLLDPAAGPEAAVPAASLHPAAARAKPPVAPAARAGMARQMVHARRAGALAVDFLHQEPGRVRRQEPQRRLFLHRRRAADDPRLRLAAQRRDSITGPCAGPHQTERGNPRPCATSRSAS